MFRFADYMVFGLALVVPIIIALYFTCIKKQKSTTEFFMANRGMNFIPLGFSLCVNYISAVTITGVPGEIVHNGWLFPYTWLLVNPIAALLVGNVFLPVFHKMKLISAYEYLGLRYESRAVRLLGTLSYGIGIIMYMSVVLYAPCLALQTVTGLPIYGLICIIGIIGTLYTAMGGLKTVVWTDMFQCFVMLGILAAIIIKGNALGGGMERIWEVATSTGRVEWANWDPSPFSRSTSINIFFGQLVTWSAVLSTHQTQIQRYCASKSVSQARWALFLSVVMVWVVHASTILSGLVIYGTYWSCDPKSQGLISQKDEIVTLFVQEHLGVYQGLLGLFTASLLSAALSTLSSGYNSLAAVIWQDIFVSFNLIGCGVEDESNAKKQLLITRMIATSIGLISVGIAAIAPSLPGVLQVSSTSLAVLGGPLFATFLLGFFTKFSNKIGAVCGILIGDAAALWLMVGAYIWKPPSFTKTLPTFDLGCGMAQNETLCLDVAQLVLGKNGRVGKTTTASVFYYVPDGDWQTIFYSTSYHLYSVFGFIICFLVNVVMSLVADWVLACIGSKRQFVVVDSNLLHPLAKGKLRDQSSPGQHFRTYNKNNVVNVLG